MIPDEGEIAVQLFCLIWFAVKLYCDYPHAVFRLGHDVVVSESLSNLIKFFNYIVQKVTKITTANYVFV